MTDESSDRFEKWIDGALSTYSDVEPRPGLENRVLAHLYSSQRAAVVRRKQLWIAAFSGIAALAACVAIVQFNRGSGEVAVVVPGREGAQTQHAGAASVAKNGPPATAPRHMQAAKRKRAQRPGSQPEPRLAQFPSPRPLTSEEELLKALLNRFPSEAVLVAREQNQRMQELEQMYEQQDKANSEQEK